MMPALTLALGQSTTNGKVRQVIFVTDGSVGNETALLDYIKRHLKHSRLFTVGIGSAPNGYFMRKAAEYGQGSFTYIGKISEVKAKMGELFAKLENPVLTRIRIDWKGRPVEHYPKYIPDLYLSEPVVIAARLPNLGGSAEITGWLDGKPWAVDFTLDGGRSHSGIDRLFAQRKIEFLTSSLSEGIAHDAVRKAIVQLGLTHHLVTKHTSLVAVEHVVSRPQNEQLDSSAVPTNLPKGWVYDGVFGSRGEEKVEQAKLKKLEEKIAANPGLKTAEKMTVATTKRYTTAQGPGVLPRTATPAALLLLIGLLLLVTAAWFWTRQPQVSTVALSTN
jgi:Ca-activated chloride channel family protein